MRFPSAIVETSPETVFFDYSEDNILRLITAGNLEIENRRARALDSRGARGDEFTGGTSPMRRLEWVKPGDRGSLFSRCAH
jgi:hypothetical protein